MIYYFILFVIGLFIYKYVLKLKKNNYTQNHAPPTPSHSQSIPSTAYTQSTSYIPCQAQSIPTPTYSTKSTLPAHNTQYAPSPTPHIKYTQTTRDINTCILVNVDKYIPDILLPNDWLIERNLYPETNIITRSIDKIENEVNRSKLEISVLSIIDPVIPDKLLPDTWISRRRLTKLSNLFS